MTSADTAQRVQHASVQPPNKRLRRCSPRTERYEQLVANTRKRIKRLHEPWMTEGIGKYGRVLQLVTHTL
jgi:hypothetical protein